MKENFEWVQSWCDQANSDDLPRALLIGDSITRQYQNIVRESLAGKWYVDYLSTSYAVDSPVYSVIIKAFLKDSDYAAIHFNNGLHGFHISGKTYKEKLNRLFKTFPEGAKVILATTTCVNEEGNEREDGEWTAKIKERNEILKELTKQNGFAVNDLYSVSKKIKKEFRANDGTHYEPLGAAILAEAVIKSIKLL